MSLKESIEKRLLYKNTEEIRPGLFVQLNKGKYKQVKPMVWKGEWKLKGQFTWRNLFTMLAIIFVVGTYIYDSVEINKFNEDPFAYCEELYLKNPEGNPISVANFDLSLLNFTKENGEITNTLFDNVE